MNLCQSDNLNFFTSFGSDILSCSPSKALASHASHISHISNALDNSSYIDFHLYDRHSQKILNSQKNINKNQDFLSSFEKNKIVNYEFLDKRFSQDYDLIYEKVLSKEIVKGVVYNSLKINFQNKVSVNNFTNFTLDSIERNHIYGFYNDKQGVIGLSPELLLTRNNQEFVIDAIAGTSHNHQDLESHKIVSEHQAVVDSIIEKLNHAKISYKIDNKYKIKFRNYFHWYQSIRISSNLEVDKIIKYLAPTAAIAGYPRDNFQKLHTQIQFESNENFLNYAGCFHFKHELFEKVVVGIRNIEWNESTAYIHAGCGININSNIEHELNESHMKMRETLRYFGYELE